MRGPVWPQMSYFSTSSCGNLTLWETLLADGGVLELSVEVLGSFVSLIAHAPRHHMLWDLLDEIASQQKHL